MVTLCKKPHSTVSFLNRKPRSRPCLVAGWPSGHIFQPIPLQVAVGFFPSTFALQQFLTDPWTPVPLSASLPPGRSLARHRGLEESFPSLISLLLSLCSFCRRSSWLGTCPSLGLQGLAWSLVVDSEESRWVHHRPTTQWENPHEGAGLWRQSLVESRWLFHTNQNGRHRPRAETPSSGGP